MQGKVGKVPLSNWTVSVTFGSVDSSDGLNAKCQIRFSSLLTGAITNGAGCMSMDNIFSGEIREPTTTRSVPEEAPESASNQASTASARSGSETQMPFWVALQHLPPPKVDAVFIL